MDIAQAVPLADSWGMHDDIGAGWWIVMMIGMVLFWGAVLLGIVWMVRNVAWGGGAPRDGLAGRESPVEILDRRFAEGAITPEDYRARREILVGGASDTTGAGAAEGAR